MVHPLTLSCPITKLARFYPDHAAIYLDIPTAYFHNRLAQSHCQTLSPQGPVPYSQVFTLKSHEIGCY